MRVDISTRTLMKLTALFHLKGILSVKDFPDLDCQFVVKAILADMKRRGYHVNCYLAHVNSYDVTVIIYDAQRYQLKDVQNYFKKLKF